MMLANTEAAALAGVAASTWRKYVSDGYAPSPDMRLGGKPFWRPETIERWKTIRPGQGARTDISRSGTR